MNLGKKFILTILLFSTFHAIAEQIPTQISKRMRASFHLLACNFEQCFAKLDSQGFVFEMDLVYEKNGYTYHTGKYEKTIDLPTGDRARVEANLGRAKQSNQEAEYFFDLKVFYQGEYKHQPNLRLRFKKSEDLQYTEINGEPKFYQNQYVYFPQIKINDSLIPQSLSIHSKNSQSIQYKTPDSLKELL